MGQAAFQLGGEVGFRRGNVNGLSGFASEPLIQFIGRSGDEAAFALDRHAFMRPALNDGDRLSQKGGDLLPSFEEGRRMSVVWRILTSRTSREAAYRRGLSCAFFGCGLLLLFWHNVSMRPSVCVCCWYLRLAGGAFSLSG
jgi:hypothetical protein